jgi:hypothetical protein
MIAMTPTKLALAGAAAAALSAAFIFQRTLAPLVLPTEQSIMAKNARTLALAQMPFETPSWVPDEATKIKALKRAYQLNGNSMVGDHMIDVSKEDLTEHVTADQPAHAEAEIVDPKSRNALDAQADEPKDWDARRRFMNRTFRETRLRYSEAKPKDVCAKHGMHKVVYRGSWRCRK